MDDVLRLPEGVFFLGVAKLGSALYVRPGVYGPLFDELLRQKNRGERHLVLSGTPGVGKSTFLYYAMWRIVKEALTDVIIFERLAAPAVATTAYAYVRFERGKPVLEGGLADFMRDLRGCQAWCASGGHCGRGLVGRPTCPRELTIAFWPQPTAKLNVPLHPPPHPP